MDHSLPGSSVHGILQSTKLKWIAISFLLGIFLTQGSNPCLLSLLHWQEPSSLRLAPPTGGYPPVQSGNAQPRGSSLASQCSLFLRISCPQADHSATCPGWGRGKVSRWLGPNWTIPRLSLATITSQMLVSEESLQMVWAYLDYSPLVFICSVTSFLLMSNYLTQGLEPENSHLLIIIVHFEHNHFF